MASFMIQIPDEDLEDLKTSIAENYGYEAQIIDPDNLAPSTDPLTGLPDASWVPNARIPNPETRDMFMARIVLEFLMGNKRSGDVKKARKNAEQALKDEREAKKNK